MLPSLAQLRPPSVERNTSMWLSGQHKPLPTCCTANKEPVLEDPDARKVGAASRNVREDPSIHDFQHGRFLGSRSRGRGYLS